MIIDRLDNAVRYSGLHPSFANAFEVLRGSNLDSLPDGRLSIRGDRLYLMIARREGVPRDKGILESHRRYVDIHSPIRGTDTIGWRALSDCSSIVQAYDPAQDIEFYSDAPSVWTAVQPGMFAIFFPEDAHAPMIGEGLLHKAVMKVAL